MRLRGAGVARTLGGMWGALGDLGRLTWGLLYWNSRKTLFRLSGATGPAPCQHPSDSGAAGETACEACLGWRSPRRFRRLCPLLTAGPDGRRLCGVASAAVRPFWGRALAFYGCAAAFLAVLGVLAAFTVLRVVGYRVPLWALAWPPAWGRVHQARADYFQRLAVRSLEAGDLRGGFLALGRAYALDPDNAQAGRLLARLTEASNPDYSDRIYARLLDRRLGDPEEAAQAWLRSLLVRGDLAGAGRLAARMLRAGTARGPAWTEAVLFAAREEGGLALLDGLWADPGDTPPQARAVIGLDRTLRSGTVPARLTAVELALGGARTPFETYCALRSMIALGGAASAAAFLNGPGAGVLAAYDRESLLLDAYAVLGWRSLLQREARSLAGSVVQAPAAILLSGHLIRHPDPALAAQVLGDFEERPLATAPENRAAHQALLCMAGVNGLRPERLQETERSGLAASSARLADFFDGGTPSGKPADVLAALDALPIEVLYAFTDHYRVPAPPGAP